VNKNIAPIVVGPITHKKQPFLKDKQYWFPCKWSHAQDPAHCKQFMWMPPFRLLRPKVHSPKLPFVIHTDHSSPFSAASRTHREKLRNQSKSPPHSSASQTSGSLSCAAPATAVPSSSPSSRRILFFFPTPSVFENNKIHCNFGQIWRQKGTQSLS
jgi:hypothetical protein